jgi:small-conductance mechanosensitive channel
MPKRIKPAKKLITALVLLFATASWASQGSNQAKKQIMTSGSKKKAPSEANSKMTSTMVEERIRDIQVRIRSAEAEENEQTARALNISLSQLQDRAAKLRAIEGVYQRLITAIQKQDSLASRETFLRQQEGKSPEMSLSQSPPYSLSFYDKLMDELIQAEAQKETAELSVTLVGKRIEDTQKRIDEIQKTIRALKEQLEKGQPEKTPANLLWSLEQAKLEESLAKAMLDYHKINYANLKKELQFVDIRIAIAKKNVAWGRSKIHFDEEDLDKQLKFLLQRKSELQSRADELTRRQNKAEIDWLRAKKEVDEAQDNAQKQIAATKLQAHEAWRHTYQRSVEQIEDTRQHLSLLEKTWKSRYALVKGGVEPENLRTWRKDAEQWMENTERVLLVQERDQSNIRSKITTVEKQMSIPDLDSRIKFNLTIHMEALKKTSENNIEYIGFLMSTLQMNHRFLDEISSRHEQISLGKKLKGAAIHFKKVWSFELFVINDKSVTVKKVITALFILIIGIFVLKRLIKALRNRVFPHSHIETTTAAIIEKLLYYFALLLLFLFALRMVNIPLTAFAFFGGAIAIGVGFGAQNLINNFISGFIIMAERPIKIGDIVDVDGNFAIVEEIGARCTRIRTGANVHILVPNSSFLEKNITNWTLSDQMIRTSVTVGVIYGSPVQDVRRLLIQAVMEQAKVLKQPEPFVLFNDFGDNSLIFDVYFWIKMMRLLDRRLIESHVRFRVDELFREAGIVIAFPQRDVHLDAKKPLELRIVGPGAYLNNAEPEEK